MINLLSRPTVKESLLKSILSTATKLVKIFFNIYIERLFGKNEQSNC